MLKKYFSGAEGTLNIITFIAVMIATPLYSNMPHNWYGALYLIAVFTVWAFASIFVQTHILKAKVVSNWLYISGIFFMPAVMIATAAIIDYFGWFKL